MTLKMQRGENALVKVKTLVLITTFMCWSLNYCLFGQSYSFFLVTFTSNQTALQSSPDILNQRSDIWYPY